MTTNTVLLAEEPTIFDTANKTLSANWVDWYLIKNNTESGPAVAAGNERLATMIRLFPLVTEEAGSDIRRQLLDLKKDMEAYLHVFSIIAEINQNGWYHQILPGDPSIFATSGPSSDLRAWVVSLATERGVPRTSINVFIQIIANSIISMDLSKYDHSMEVPPLQSIVEGFPSMLWVVDYAARNNVTVMDAHDVGVQQLCESASLDA